MSGVPAFQASTYSSLSPGGACNERGRKGESPKKSSAKVQCHLDGMQQ